jgi:hypothetical protein
LAKTGGQGMSDEPKTELNSITIEAADGGWIIKEKGHATLVKFQWRAVISHLEERLTSIGDRGL